jgi:hypothetical protein
VTCASARRLMSDDRDGALSREDRQELRQHVARCSPCRAHERLLAESLDALAELPPLYAPEPIARSVFDRLELESRSPGLALLFRPAWRARPLMLPSLVPAVLVLCLVVIGTAALGRQPAGRAGLREAGWGTGFPAFGTEGNPLPPTSDVSAPRVRADWPLAVGLLDDVGEDAPVFVETVVARDGRVSAVRLLGGDQKHAEAIVEALRQQRYEPGRLKGRPVAVSVYRLFSRMDVRAPIT